MSTSKNRWFNFLWLPDKKYLIFLIILTLMGSAVLGFLTPRWISEFYATYEDENLFLYYLKLLGILFIGEYLVRVGYQFCVNKYIQSLLKKMREESYRNWLLSYESFTSKSNKKEKYPLGEVLSRIMSDTEAVIELISSGSFAIFIDFIFIISCLISFLTLNTTSGISLIIAEVSVCIFLVWASRFMARIYLDVRKSTGLMSKTLANVTAGMRTMFYTPNGGYASKKSESSFDDFLKIQLKANVWDASYFSIAESLFPILLALLVVVIPYSNIVEMAIVAAIIDLIQRSIAPIKDIASKISSIQRAKAGILRMEEFNHDLSLQLSSSMNDSFEAHDLKRIQVAVDEFYYRADTKNDFKLENISFDGHKGEVIGIVGLSGSGKSTLLKILSTEILCPKSLITYEATSGEKILFNGEQTQRVSEYRRQVSIISQESHVFSATLEFNITLGFGDLLKFEFFWKEMKEKIPYLNRWGIDEKFLIQPKKLSLGQKQLISALRSCYLNKPIVLFDEVSSGLDSDLEYALRQVILLIQKQSLTIIVAHRVETIIDADKILVMEKGRLVDIGKHDELMSRSAVYQEFISQLRALV